MRYVVYFFLSLGIWSHAAARALLVPEYYETIASALAAAGFGDSLSLAAGTYYEHDLWLPPGVSLLGRSGHGEDIVIDALAQGRVLEGEDLVLENRVERLTLRNGYLYCCYGVGFRAIGSPRLEDVVIEDNTGDYGDGIGMYCMGQPDIRSTVFRRNRALGQGSDGGGLRLNGMGIPHPLLTDVTFIENEAGMGGGLYMDGYRGILSRLVFVDNIASSLGGGIYFMNMGSDGQGPEIVDSFFMGNSAFSGGGVLAVANVHIHNCTFVGNYAQPEGGAAIYAGGSWDLPSTPQVFNCIVAFNNGGGGIRLDQWPWIHIECCDVYGNVGGNYVGQQSDWTGTYGNISEDPLFCGNGDPWDYSIYNISPCAPDGNSCGVLIGAFDVACQATATMSANWSSLKRLY